jgi:hypothetical protein
MVLTRDPRRLTKAAPHVAGHVAITLETGDVKSFDDPRVECTHVLHMATETALAASATASFETAVKGTQRVLGFAARRGVRKLLLTSSGAVYGPQPPDCERLSEEDIGAPRPNDVSAVTLKASAPRSSSVPLLPRRPIWRPRSPAVSRSSVQCCRRTPTSPSATSSATPCIASISRLPATVRRAAPAFTRPTSPYGYGPSCSGVSRADRTMSAQRRT